MNCIIKLVGLDREKSLSTCKTSDGHHTLFLAIIFIKWHKKRIQEICNDLTEQFSTIHVLYMYMNMYNLKGNLSYLPSSPNR